MFALAIWDGRDRGARPGARPLRHQAALLLARRRGSCASPRRRAPSRRAAACRSKSIRRRSRASSPGGRCRSRSPSRKSIRALPAGHWARVAGDGSFVLETRSARSPSDDGRPADAAEALAASVRAHLVSDVPVGIFLSAGLDSALVARSLRRRASAGRAAHRPDAHLGRSARHRRPTRSRSPAPPPRRCGLRHVVREIDGAEVRRRAAGDPPGDGPAVDRRLQHLAGRPAGEGGGSQGRPLRPRRRRALRRLQLVPRRARAGAPRPGACAASPASPPPGRGLARRLAPRNPEARRACCATARASPAPTPCAAPSSCRTRWTGSSSAQGSPSPASAPTTPLSTPGSSWAKRCSATRPTCSGDPWRTVHRLESSLYLRHQLLRDSDWAGMAHGVEIRVPLVDAWLRAEIGSLDFEPARSQGKAALVAPPPRSCPTSSSPAPSPASNCRSPTGWRTIPSDAGRAGWERSRGGWRCWCSRRSELRSGLRAEHEV